MKALGRADGGDASTGVSYLHLAELLQKYVSHPDRDLRELWSRIVFNISEDDNSQNLELVLSVAKYFRVKPHQTFLHIHFLRPNLKTPFDLSSQKFDCIIVIACLIVATIGHHRENEFEKLRLRLKLKW